MTKEEIESKLTDCLETKTCRNSPFSKWDEEFLESVQEQFQDRGSLSKKQEEMLLKIWDKI